nr:MAG TPA: hypothetical protein [Caudoviricetes sp.]
MAGNFIIWFTLPKREGFFYCSETSSRNKKYLIIFMKSVDKLSYMIYNEHVR